MKKVMIGFLILAALAGLTLLVVRVTPNWEGVDDTVVGRYAQQAGHPARKAYIDTDRGDMLLFFFLMAGVAGGFVGGYCFRDLFPPEAGQTADAQFPLAQT